MYHKRPSLCTSGTNGHRTFVAVRGAGAGRRMSSPTLTRPSDSALAGAKVLCVSGDTDAAESHDVRNRIR